MQGLGLLMAPHNADLKAGDGKKVCCCDECSDYGHAYALDRACQQFNEVDVAHTFDMGVVSMRSQIFRGLQLKR